MLSLLCLALGTTVISCSKDKVEPTPVEVKPKVEVVSKIDPEKLKRIETFMIKMLLVSPDAKKYDPSKEMFYIDSLTMTRVKMEELYDSANEYKINHEKN